MGEQRTAKAVAVALAAAGAVGTAWAEPSVLDNGTIRVGIELDYGGAMIELRSVADGRNLINNFDRGRHVQQSYYSGPAGFDPNGTMHRDYPNWPWNPVQAGDVYNNRAKVLEHRNDGREIYVKSRPMQWALDNIAGDCVMETWYRLDGNVVRVRNRLTNARADMTWYGARHQELPAVYTVGTLDTLHTYRGDRPFSDAATTTIENAGPPWAYWLATEGWAAYTDAKQFGVGVYHPTARQFVGGYHGQRGVGGPDDSPTGYISPLHTEVLDHDIVYDFNYDLIVGSLGDIRAHARANARDLRPDVRFVGGRHHWHVAGEGVSDEGVHDTRGWRVNVHGTDPQILSPLTSFAADQVTTLYVELAVHTRDGGRQQGQLFWTIHQPDAERAQGFARERSVAFEVIADGAYRVYAIELAKHANWRGLITQLRLDPIPVGQAGDHLYLRTVSFRAPPVLKDSSGAR